MNPGSLLDAVVGSTRKEPKAPPRPKRPVINDGVKHEPFNQCPHCLVVNAYCIILPAAVHVRQLDGSIKVEYIGEGYFECKYCHIIDNTRGKGKQS